MDRQQIRTMEGEEIHLSKGHSGWPYINGERVGAVNFISDDVIALTVQDHVYYLQFAEYHRAMTS